MKNLISFFVFAICFLPYAKSQEFSFKMFFEDAIGNKDSIVIGFDPNATNGIDEDFGEVNIYNAMWTKDLELRAGETSSGIMNNYDTTEDIINSKIQIIKKDLRFFDMLIILKAVKTFFKNFMGYNRFSSDLLFGTLANITSDSMVGELFDGVLAFLNL